MEFGAGPGADALGAGAPADDDEADKEQPARPTAATPADVDAGRDSEGWEDAISAHPVASRMRQEQKAELTTARSRAQQRARARVEERRRTRSLPPDLDARRAATPSPRP